jgi:amino acid adenylation domain-containing protein
MENKQVRVDANYLLHQGIAVNAGRFPEKAAVRCGNEELSYLELFQLSNQLAHVLQSSGVKRGDRVGIYMFKNVHSAVAMYGIMSAGAAYVPLDPFAPLERIQFVIENCNIKILVTHERKAKEANELGRMSGLDLIVGIPQSSATVNCIAWPKVKEFPSEPLNIRLTEQDLAYILYTSGSTGTPKGIVHTHRSGLSFANWAVETYGLKAEDRISNHAPLHFDLSTFDYFASSIVGATTCIIPEAVTKFPASMAKWIQDEKITVWYSVPYALIQMLQRANLQNRDFSCLRWVLFAGEPFPTKHLRELMAVLPSPRFSNLYGPTETNVCTFYHVPPLSETNDDPIPIGIACSNIEDLVADGDGAEVKEGEIGELLIRGGVVMKGYWGRPDLTEKGFFKRRIADQFDDIFYHTGDLVQKLPDGNYKFLGRKDRQIKTRGYRVELDEIETLLLAVPEVAEAAVYPVPDGEGSNLIEAAVIPKDGMLLSKEQLFVELGKKLPPYALPSEIHLQSDFPRTSTGKIDRRGLQVLLQNQKIAGG